MSLLFLQLLLTADALFSSTVETDPFDYITFSEIYIYIFFYVLDGYSLTLCPSCPSYSDIPASASAP